MRKVPSAAALLLLCACAWLAACSSVPDVRYVDEEDAATPSGDAGQADGESSSCPDVPGSTCCVDVVCIGCESATGASCAECREACGPTQLCCRKGNGMICKSLNAACN